MIILFFLLTCLSGLIQEVRTLLYKETPTSIKLPYALGSLFFLFWHEPYINYGLVLSLLFLSIIDFFGNDKIERLNSAFCIVAVVGLIVNFILFYS